MSRRKTTILQMAFSNTLSSMTKYSSIKISQNVVLDGPINNIDKHK